MTTALKIFRSLCTVLIGKHDTITIPDIEDLEDNLHNSPLTQEEDEEDRTNARTIVGRFPFTYEFKKVLKEVQEQLEKEETTNNKENAYFCPGIVDVLFGNYLGIFPLWSGLLLGDLKRYADGNEGDSSVPYKTRETNCHVERCSKKKTKAIKKKSKDVNNSSTDLTHKMSDTATEVDALWTCKPTEIVVAVVEQEQSQNFTLRHRDLQTLRPDELIAIECYIGAILNSTNTAGRLYHLNHYSIGVILHKSREQVTRQGLRNVRTSVFLMLSKH
ncbi:hypothetical protein Q7C36_012810 [Tachysurus vachellii]|uniref:Uncharacterized protein n=1 Tax=Tachysurus vachellii TaxID=175792 RepID=A0AA88SM06_TACVA|nr:hypothetical protein Q7C36_012810 [Tachysurus vachellii]